VSDIANKVGMGPFGSDIKVSTFRPEGVPVLNGRNLQALLLDEKCANFVSPEHAAKLGKSCVQAGDIVITHRGTLGQVSLIPDGLDHAVFVASQSQFFLRCLSSKMTPEWMVYFLRSPLGQHLLLSNKSQVGVPSIARPVTHLKSIKLVVGPLALIQKFSTLVETFHAAAVANRSRGRILESLRDQLLPRLISGQLRLPEAQAQLEEALA
jgi:type I restriction enzyme S subunit